VQAKGPKNEWVSDYDPKWKGHTGAGGMRTALARLEQLKDPLYPLIKDNFNRFVGLEKQNWCHLRSTVDMRDSLPILEALGADDLNVQSLANLAQASMAGRVEANRLLFNWMKPSSMEQLSYIRAPAVYQGAIRASFQDIQKPPCIAQRLACMDTFSVPGAILGVQEGVHSCSSSTCPWGPR